MARRARAASVSESTLADLYRRSISETADSPSPMITKSFRRCQSVRVRSREPAPEPQPRWYCYRVRSFKVTSKGVVNRGDSLRFRQTKARPDNPAPDPDTERFGVTVLGAPRVGKTSLTKQFLTSEHIFIRSSHQDSHGNPDQSVTILMDGMESMLRFNDGEGKIPHSAQGSHEENPDGFLLVYSVASRDSFDVVTQILHDLGSDTIASKAVILVANKSDLVRAREVTPQEGRNLAIRYNIKFIETSVGINHRVDDLLVGILTQVRLKRYGHRSTNWPSLQRAGFKIRRMVHRLLGREEPVPPWDILHMV